VWSNSCEQIRSVANGLGALQSRSTSILYSWDVAGEVNEKNVNVEEEGLEISTEKIDKSI